MPQLNQLNPLYISHFISVRCLLILCSHFFLFLLNDFSSVFRTKTVCAVLVPPVTVTCHAHRVLIVIVLVIFGEEYKSVYETFIQLPLTSSPGYRYSTQLPSLQSTFLQRTTQNFIPSFISSLFPKVLRIPKFCVSFCTLV